MDQPNKKKYIPVIVILAIAICAVAYLYIPHNVKKAKVDLDNFPNKIGEWQGVDVKVNRRVYEILNPDGLLFKEYTNKKGEKVALVIVLGLNKRESFHPPEVCYSGGGGTVDSKTVEKISLTGGQTLEVNKLIVENTRNRSQQAAMFWFTAGDQHFASYYRQQIAIVWNEFKTHNSWGSLIRVSTAESPLEKKTKAVSSMESFIRELYPLLPEYINPSQRGTKK